MGDGAYARRQSTAHEGRAPQEGTRRVNERGGALPETEVTRDTPVQKGTLEGKTSARGRSIVIYL
jgi:hypothetical protein